MCESGSSRFQPGEGLLRDNKPSDRPFWSTKVNCPRWSHQTIANISSPLQICANIQVFDQFGSFLTFVNTTSSGSGGSKIYGPQVTFKFSIAYFSVLIKHVCSMFIKNQSYENLNDRKNTNKTYYINLKK